MKAKNLELTIDGAEYVAVPKAEYLKLVPSPRQAGTVDALFAVRASIAKDLLAAREHAKLSQRDLAEKLRKSQAMIAKAETGAVRVGAKYVADVLRVCGLPKDWNGNKPTALVSVLDKSDRLDDRRARDEGEKVMRKEIGRQHAAHAAKVKRRA